MTDRDDARIAQAMADAVDARTRLTVAIVQAISDAAEERDPQPERALERAEKATVYAHAIIEDVIESSGYSGELLAVMMLGVFRPLELLDRQAAEILARYRASEETTDG